jgi:serine/threonine protein phosphatase PrpC
MSFEIDVGHASRPGPRASNEDFAGALRDADPARGLVAAVADGVSAGGRGREAAQTTVMGLLADFFGVPETWETTVAFDRLIGAQNAWLAHHNRLHAGAADAAALTTLTALALRGQTWTLAHVGDTRAWLCREGGGELVQLSQDHAFHALDFRARLTRAVGLDDGLRVDYLQGDVRPGDCFVLTSDGVHGVLKPAVLAQLAQGAATGTAQQAAEAIVDAALAARTRDNATALVLRVVGLDARDLNDEMADARRLGAPPPRRPGEALDGYTVTALVADNGVHRLYQARDRTSGRLVAIKTLSPGRQGDAEERAMLAHEAWLGLRLAAADGQAAPGFVRVHPRGAAPGAEPGVEVSALYVVFDWHEGRTLRQLQAAGGLPAVAEVVGAATAIAGLVGRMHRMGVVHRDIKPDNLHLGQDGHWRVLDLGSAISGRESAAQRELHAGTPSYINPEQWDGAVADAGSDLFALGVTLYQWLTGRLPYGEVEPYQLGRYRRDPVPVARLRPDVPIWLDNLLAKAVARDPRQRFETAEELLLALERGAARPLNPVPATPLLQRDPRALLVGALVVSLLFNLLLVVWLLFLPR